MVLYQYDSLLPLHPLKVKITGSTPVRATNCRLPSFGNHQITGFPPVTAMESFGISRRCQTRCRTIAFLTFSESSFRSFKRRWPDRFWVTWLWRITKRGIGIEICSALQNAVTFLASFVMVPQGRLLREKDGLAAIRHAALMLYDWSAARASIPMTPPKTQGISPFFIVTNVGKTIAFYWISLVLRRDSICRIETLFRHYRPRWSSTLRQIRQRRVAAAEPQASSLHEMRRVCLCCRPRRACCRICGAWRSIQRVA